MKGFGLLLLVTVVAAELPPYPPSGWKPAGQRLQLPIRGRPLRQQELPVPHTVYGAPSTQAPVPHTVYGPPSTEAPSTEPTFQYGPPANEYGAPVQPEIETAVEPEDAYGQPDNEYGSPQQPGNEYGGPQQPGNEYGGPQQPGNEYGGPQQPGNEEEGSGTLPLDPGATETVRQNQFIQQLPHYKPSNFKAPERLRQGNRNNQRPQNFQQQQRPQNVRQQVPQNVRQQVPQNVRQQNARPKPQRLTTNVQITKQPIRYVQTDYKTISEQDYKRIPSRIQQAPKSANFNAQRLPNRAAAPQFQRQQQLYTTTTTTTTTQRPTTTARKIKRTRKPSTQEEIDFVPNIAVSTAVAAEYYVLQDDGNVQKVAYTNKDGQIEGEITSNLRYEDIDPVNPIYSINENNQLIRINK
ncbi:PREDICTED: basic salivary proline-rich protein 1-like [Nicrophorus vespilloides]|uniref:Basic salivary proline-rich protein 1-like n=1 Tax=Nicrophorus vespilloides TaxID=110193 RepID=A0ABM1MHM9_NICVS|nr:PREDICTED: basic salivary proline-rich protein 1-like [Nicrophorus vespilloides]